MYTYICITCISSELVVKFLSHARLSSRVRPALLANDLLWKDLALFRPIKFAKGKVEESVCTFEFADESAACQSFPGMRVRKRKKKFRDRKVRKKPSIPTRNHDYGRIFEQTIKLFKIFKYLFLSVVTFFVNMSRDMESCKKYKNYIFYVKNSNISLLN